MIAKETLGFLKKLDENNNREWFQANKKLFDAAQDNMTAFAGYLIGEIGKFDSEIKAIDPQVVCLSHISRRSIFKGQESV